MLSITVSINFTITDPFLTNNDNLCRHTLQHEPEKRKEKERMLKKLAKTKQNREMHHNINEQLEIVSSCTLDEINADAERGYPHRGLIHENYSSMSNSDEVLSSGRPQVD